MIIYSDPESNRIANEIRDDVEELGLSMGAMMDPDSKANKEIAYEILMKLHDNPIPFAIDFLNRNKERLNRLKQNIITSDSSFIELSDDVAFALIGILNFPILNGKMMSFASDFKKHLHDPEIQKIKKNLSESAWVLTSLNQLEISKDVKSQIIDLLNTVAQVEKRFKPNTGCFIATYVYGNYDYPEVIELRLFRDRYLSNSKIGRFIIDSYYEISPGLIQMFGSNTLFKILSKVLVYSTVKLIQLFTYLK
jgi:hypothetical protein